MKVFRGLLIYLLILVVVGGGLGFGVLKLASAHAKELVGLVLGGYERFTIVQTRSTLARLAKMPSVIRMDQESCASFADTKEASDNFFAVLAIGDEEGNPICSDSQANGAILPTMSDRVYFQRVKEARDMVVGEYAVSKTTGKQVLHFAYPILSESGSFRGFLLASVNLEWYINPEVDRYMGNRGVEVLGVDDMGKVLFVYPKGAAQIGQGVLSAEMVGAMFGHERDYHVMRAHDGEYKVYGYKLVSESGNKQMLYLVGVSAWAFAPIAFGVIGLMTICALVGWYWAGIVWPRAAVKQIAKKK